MKKFFINIRNKLNRGYHKIRDSKIVLSIRKAFSFIPNFLADHIPNKHRKIIWGIIFILPLMVGFVYFFFIPFITSFIYSFSYVRNDAGKGIVVTFVGLKNYIFTFTEAADYQGSFTEHLISAIIDIATDVPVILIFSLLMAVVLNSKFKGRAFVRAVFFMPVIFNSQAIDLAMTNTTALQAAVDSATAELFSNMFNFQTFLLNANIPGWLVSFLGQASDKIYDIISYSGVQILIFLSALQSVPKHLYEAAQIEGATQYEMFWKITFPMVSPMMLTAAVYTVVDSFLTSPLLNIIKVYYSPDKAESAKLGVLSDYGINAAMSWIFALVSIIMIAITMLLLSKVVFYYDEK